MEHRWLQGMVLLRGLSATAEVTAVLMMLRLARLEDAVRVNALLGMVGPVIFLLVSALGVAGMAGRLSPGRIALVGIGCLLVLLGTRSG